MPQKVAGSARNDDKRVAEILIIDDHQQVDEDGREQQADRHIAEGLVHAVDLAGYLDRVAWRELVLEISRDLADVAGDAAEIAPLRAGIDLVDWLDVGLVGAARHQVAGEGRHIAEPLPERVALPAARLSC